MRFDWLVFIKGMLMGAADIVPGVSGGTIAFITGIYERLVSSLKSVLPEVIQLLRHRRFARFWQSTNGNFLFSLFCGIVVSVLSLAKLITFLLSSYPILLWSFFFGLIVASTIIIGREVEFRRLSYALTFCVGCTSAVLLSLVAPAQIEQNALTIFGSGVLAICAMILPGISGSFILVMLGSYAFILSALQRIDLYVLLLFVSGCVVGLLSIANILSWAFAKHKQWILSLLTGFMAGALTKVWPWKEVLSYRLNRHGEQVPLMLENVSPGYYELISGQDAQLSMALICMFLSLALVLVLDKTVASNES